MVIFLLSNIYKILVDTLREKGFKQFIMEDNNRFNINFYEYLCSENKVLKK